MNRGIYSVAAGMVTSQQTLDTIANNLANTNTVGYKEDHVAFPNMLERSISGSRGTTIGTLGSGPGSPVQYTDQSQGASITTSNPLDFAIQGPGMFAFQTPVGVQYGRDGSFTADSSGTLVNKQGYPVLDTSLKPIQLKPGAIHVEVDGSISDGKSRAYGQLGIFNGAFSKGNIGLYQSTDATPQGAATAKSSTLKQGSVEGSNVNAIQTMTEMIALQHNFDMSQRAIQSQDQMTQRLYSTITGPAG